MSLDEQPWTEPGLHAVAPSVYRVPLPMPNDGLRAVNVYVIECDGGVVLIDSGWEVDEARDVLAAALAELGYGWPDVQRFLITHMHRDHYTLAVALRREYGTPVWIGAGERESLEVIVGGDESREMGDPLRWGLPVDDFSMAALGVDPSHSQIVYELPDEWIDGELDIELSGRTLRAVPTPGHTHGHTVFADLDAGLLFSGDHVLPHITPSIGLEPVVRRTALGDYLASLSRVLTYPDLVLLPAHGPVTASSHVRAKELLAHHEERLQHTVDAVRHGARTAIDVAQRLGWTGKHRAFAELGLFNQFLAVGETAAHLDHLVARGDLGVREDRGIAYYA